MIACSNDFDWADPEAVTIPEQMALAVYPNRKGVVVVRQERSWDEDSDTLVFVDPSHALTIAEAILEAAGIDATITEAKNERTNSPALLLAPRRIVPQGKDRPCPSCRGPLDDGGVCPACSGQSPKSCEVQEDLLGGKVA